MLSENVGDKLKPFPVEYTTVMYSTKTHHENRKPTTPLCVLSTLACTLIHKCCSVC